MQKSQTVVEQTKKEEDSWSGIPKVATDWKWTYSNGPLFQRVSKKGYQVDLVLSSLEKAILSGNVNESLFWATEYLSMGKQIHLRCAYKEMLTTFRNCFH